MNKVKIVIQLIKNMGLKYIFFRILYAVKIKSGFFRLRFPIDPEPIKVISVETWRSQLPGYFFHGKEINGLQRHLSSELKERFDDLNHGILTYFGKTRLPVGKEYDWITNPLNGYKYDIRQHWSLINDLSEKAGDIKYVWEKARFSFIYDIIRYDYHSGVDCSQLVFDEIRSFIDKNPVNMGPNYICSQEISLRVINWAFALFYYKDSQNLTDELFCKIMNSIYWQIRHVFNNIGFSRIAVRNNHALTETLLLYLSDLLFPFLPDVKIWSKKGKKWFEQEIVYQIYEDGTYLQFSHNYHRVVIQLLTLAVRLSEINGDKFIPEVYIRARKSLDFLYNSMDLSSGILPNWGANDGALFFKLNDQDFRDFRPQLQVLSYALSVQDSYDFGEYISEDLTWFGYAREFPSKLLFKINNRVFSYQTGGIYIIRDSDTMTCVICSKHKDRPAHSDNLHLDIWYKGINYFRDGGSFMYNTEPEFIKYFMGTESHNTVMLNGFDQMLKGSRFIWYYWSQAKEAEIKEYDDRFEFEGSIGAFRHVGNNIFHYRRVTKFKGRARWNIEDIISGTAEYEMNQLWHFNPEVKDFIRIEATDDFGMPLLMKSREGWNSSYYGEKERTQYWSFSTNGRKIITAIEIVE